MNNPNVKFISKEKLLNSPEIYHKVNSSKTADEGCNNNHYTGMSADAIDDSALDIQIRYP